MPVSEQELRTALHQHRPAGRVRTDAALEAGRRKLRRRRARRAAGALALPVLLGAGIVVASGAPHTSYALVGSGLTLAAGSTGPVQVATDRVDLGDGIQAWRGNKLLYVGYPARPYAELDTHSLSTRWGNLGYDAAIFSEAGQHEGSTIVVGSVRGKPTSVVVTLEGVSQPATIACFKQAPGWCVYKANVPTSFRDNNKRPRIQVR